MDASYDQCYVDLKVFLASNCKLGVVPQPQILLVCSRQRGWETGAAGLTPTPHLDKFLRHTFSRQAPQAATIKL